MFCLGTLLLLSGGAQAKETIAVYGVTAETRALDAGAASAITSVIEDAIIATGRFQVLGRRDMDRMREEASFQISDECSSEDAVACYAELGGAAGARYLVSGEVSRLGKTWVLVLRQLDMQTTAAVASGRATCKGDAGCLLDAAEEAVGDLFGIAASAKSVAGLPPPPPPPPAKKSSGQDRGFFANIGNRIDRLQRSARDRFDSDGDGGRSQPPEWTTRSPGARGRKGRRRFQAPASGPDSGAAEAAAKASLEAWVEGFVATLARDAKAQDPAAVAREVVEKARISLRTAKRWDAGEPYYALAELDLDDLNNALFWAPAHDEALRGRMRAALKDAFKRARD